LKFEEGSLKMIEGVKLNVEDVRWKMEYDG
jgi:hypothetical protein